MPGRCVMGQGDAAEREQDFTDQGLVEGESAGGKAGGGGRMGVDHGVDVGPHAVDGQVHGDFAADVAEAGQAAAVHVHHHQVFGGHHALADAGGGDEDGAIVEARGDVAVGGGDEAALVQHFADAEDFQPGFVLAHYGFNPVRICPLSAIVP